MSQEFQGKVDFRDTVDMDGALGVKGELTVKTVNGISVDSDIPVARVGETLEFKLWGRSSRRPCHRGNDGKCLD